MKRETSHVLNVDGQTIVVIERVASEAWAVDGQRWFAGSLVPVGVVFEQDGKTIALDMEGNPLDGTTSRATLSDTSLVDDGA